MSVNFASLSDELRGSSRDNKLYWRSKKKKALNEMHISLHLVHLWVSLTYVSHHLHVLGIQIQIIADCSKRMNRGPIGEIRKGLGLMKPCVMIINCLCMLISVMQTRNLFEYLIHYIKKNENEYMWPLYISLHLVHMWILLTYVYHHLYVLGIRINTRVIQKVLPIVLHNFVNT